MAKDLFTLYCEFWSNYDCTLSCSTAQLCKLSLHISNRHLVYCVTPLLYVLLGRKLTVINMNQQSDTSDLLGGYKPVMISRIISPLRDQFESLFCQTFSRQQNAAFLGMLHGMLFCLHFSMVLCT